MATVLGMSYTVGDLPLGENKGVDSAFCWQDGAADDAGSADFFDQFVVLDDHGPDHSPSPPFTDEEGGGAEGGGNESFESMCREALESSLSPRLTSLRCPPLDHHPSAEKSLGVGDHDRANVTANNPASGRLGRFSSAKFPPLHRQVRAGSHVDLSNMDCQYSQQQQHQLLVAGQRELNSILGTGYNQEGPGSGGSISDSKLLRLEGLTVNGSGSPRIHLLPSSASVPPSPHLQPGSASTSPRKSRLEAFYTKIRNKAANLHGIKHQKQHPATTAAPAVTSSIPSTMGTSPNKMKARPRPHNLSLVRPKMPLSLPLTGQMTAEQNGNIDGNNAHLFNTNFMDDPFMGISSNLSLPMHTPIQTPHQQHQSIPVPVTTAGGDNLWQFSVSGPPPTTPANPIGGVSSSASELHPLYATTINDSNNNWWDQAVGDAMDTDPDPSSSSLHMGINASNTREATLNLQMALQQLHDQASFDEHHFGLDTSGLVMHMPQTTSRVSLHHNQQQQQQLNQNQSQSQAQAQAHAAAQLLLAQQQYISNHGGGISDGLPSQQSSSSTSTTTTTTTTARSRRPKPRAPSSGASRLPSYQTSPRKVRAASRSSLESSPTHGSQQPNYGNLAIPDTGNSASGISGSGRQRLHRRSASMQNINNHSSNTTSAGAGLGLGLGLMSPAAVRKRKSFTTGGRGHGSSVSLSAGSRLSHAASHGDLLGASASAFAAAIGIGASGQRVVPEDGARRGLSSSASTSSLPATGGNSSGRFTPLNGLNDLNVVGVNGFHGHSHHGVGMVQGYPPMPPLPPQHQHQHHSQHHGLPHHPHHSRSHSSQQHSKQQLPVHPSSSSSSSRHPPSKPTPRSTSASKSHSRSRSTSNNHSSNSNSQPSSRGGEGIGFVNFTPRDHQTLMSGVAPSGSSKTKARRERETAEQRRKLSEAMMKVVEAAGGDVRKFGELGVGMGVKMEFGGNMNGGEFGSGNDGGGGDNYEGMHVFGNGNGRGNRN